MKMNKKAISPFLSWILLLALVILIGSMVAAFMRSTSETTATTVEKLTDQQECTLVSLSVTDMCQKPLNLYINITNNNLLTITELKFRIVDITNSSDNLGEQGIINPGEEKQINLLTSDLTRQITIIPVTRKDNKIIICEQSKYTTENIKACS